MSDTPRRFDLSLDIAAAPEDVWRALTQAGELTRWFPLNAEVTPGRGGSVFWSWGEAWPWRLGIEEWEPGRRLLLHQAPDAYQQFDGEGRPLPHSPRPSAPIALEFTLERQGAGTRLRVVHSGFGPGAEWDDEFDGISHGWPFELRGLRLYLERHRGRDRQAAMVRRSTVLSIPEAWARLTGPDGYALRPAAPAEGDTFEAGPRGGARYAGRVELLLPRRELFGVVPELGDAQLRLSTHRAAGQTGVLAWLAAWGAPRPEVARFEAEAEKVLSALFTS